MGVDVADALLGDIGASERGAHHLRDPDGLRLGRGHVVRVVRRAVPEDLGVDLRPAGASGFELLEHEHAGALAHDEAGTGGVKRTRGARRVLVLGHEPAHRDEPGQDQRMQTRLGTA